MNTSQLLRLAGLATALALAGCSTTGTSDTDPEITTPDQLTFDEYTSLGQDIANRNQALGGTDPSTLPVSGSANYAGYVALGGESFPQLLGDITLQVNFAGAGGVTGQAQNFIEEDGTRALGVLDLSGGSFDRNAPVQQAALLDVEMTGELAIPDAVEVNAMFDVVFAGETAEGLSGRGEPDGSGGYFVFSGGTFQTAADVSVVAEQVE